MVTARHDATDRQRFNGEVSAVGLEPVVAENWRRALLVTVRPEQLAFVADHQPVALVILAKSYVRPGGRQWEPLAIVDEVGNIVGLVALAHSGTSTEMLHLAIDAASQGQGLGTAAVDAIIGYVHRGRPSCRELTLSVHPDNELAQHVYRSAGFEPTGALRDGEPLFALELARS